VPINWHVSGRQGVQLFIRLDPGKTRLFYRWQGDKITDGTTLENVIV
jgi:hypothetical protein